MSDAQIAELGWVEARGTPREVGRALGQAGRDAMHGVLLAADYWKAVTDPAHSHRVGAMAARVRRRFPAIWEELTGLADGLDLPLDQVVAWNCRGDILSNVPDGCTTVQLPGETPVIAHNEDGLPGFRGHCFMAEITPDTGPGFVSFCYPGSLPGHTFAVTTSGLVQAVNNLRLRNMQSGLPRMVIGRAVLTHETLDDALGLLHGEKGAGGFHLTLARAGEARLASVEFGAGACSVRMLERPAVHANHALHMGAGAVGQTVTRSSADRQARGSALVGGASRDPLGVLRDTGGGGLPIHRTAPDDPDCENTLATALFRVGKSAVDWRVHDQISQGPVYSGRSRTD